MISIFKSFALMVSTSTLIAVVLGLYYNANYIAVFLISMIVQFALGFIIASIRDPYLKIQSEKIENERMNLLNQQGLELKCAHCSSSSFVPIRLDEHNNYTCPHCNNSNAVYMNVTVARETSMLNVGRLTTNSIDDESIVIEQLRHES